MVDTVLAAGDKKINNKWNDLDEEMDGWSVG